jgi:hypothetical protein
MNKKINMSRFLRQDLNLLDLVYKVLSYDDDLYISVVFINNVYEIRVSNISKEWYMDE